MSDEEYDDDELPAVSVDCSARAPAAALLPPAGELAAQRERERHVERELRALRDRARRLAEPERAQPPPAPGTVPHSDSSGSEGEAALAAAVRALRAREAAAPAPAPGAPRARARRAARLAAALAARLAPEQRAPLAALAALLAAGRGAHTAARTDEVLRVVCEALCAGGVAWEARGVLQCAALLGALCAGAGPGGCALRVRRALHHLVDARASHDQVVGVSRLLGDSALEAAGADAGAGAGAGAGAARLLLELSDCARSGGAGGDLLAALLLSRALQHLLREAGAEAEGPAEAGCALEPGAVLGAARWRALGAGEQLLCVRLCGRALALAGARGRRPGAAPAHDRDRARHCPDQLKVEVAAARLQLLFRATPAPASAPASVPAPAPAPPRDK